MSKILLIAAAFLSGCASMSQNQKAFAWAVVGGVAVTSIGMALDDDPSPRADCLSWNYRADVGAWYCQEPGFYDY